MPEDTPTAARLLRNRLAELGIPTSTDGHPSSGCDWVSIEVRPGSEIWFTSTETSAINPPEDHGGWLACHYPDLDWDSGDLIEVYFTGIKDFDLDTEAAITAVRRYMADPAPWQRPGYAAECGPYITAGEYLVRALRAAGLDVLPDPGTGPTGYINAYKPGNGPQRPFMLIDTASERVDHRPEQHIGWRATYYTDHQQEEGESVYVSDVTGFDQDTAAVVNAVREFILSPYSAAYERAAAWLALQEARQEPETDPEYTATWRLNLRVTHQKTRREILGIGADEREAIQHARSRGVSLPTGPHATIMADLHRDGLTNWEHTPYGLALIGKN